jgi:aspartyl-tRNA(Asn)/glutamyl-tRNA(Gln) amidotransferase subunit C
MEVNEDLIRRVAKLSRLKLNRVEIEKFTKDFKDILESFKVLDEVDVKDTKSSFRPIEEKNNLRKDVIKESISSEDALRFTKNQSNNYFIGPKVVD